ncbi:hypothetical protein TIFTF001_003371 [Ficus carica]|uniref:Uncharacterized protein n=1 Tax=Ficus carica TaxID=3494 RepID=A0AA87ZB24_FICCA|nr:hypothetical protein TIFTF001_003371 [Ficus carica]
MKTEQVETTEVSPASGPGHDGGAGDRNRSIPELIDHLRTAFRFSEYDFVQGILVAREDKLKREIEKKEERCELAEKRLGIVGLRKAEAEEELKSFKAKSAESMEEMRLRATAAEERAKAAEERAKRSEERYETLFREVKKAESEKSGDLVELKRKNAELDFAKMRAEEELQLWKRRFGGLEERVEKLETDIVEIINANNRGTYFRIVHLFKDMFLAAAPAPTILISDSDDDCGPRATSSERESPPRVLKRKRSSSENVNENENVVPDGSTSQDQERVIELGGGSGNPDPATGTSATNGAANQNIPVNDGQGVSGPLEANAEPKISDFSYYVAMGLGDELDGLMVTSSSSDSDSE